MQLIADGPDIPDELFQQLEDEKLVLFCGAGLSMKAGLPDFTDLVRQVIAGTGVSGAPSPDDDQLDRILGYIEKKIEAQMRQEVLKILTRKPRRGGTSSHRAVLELSRLKSGYVRCVTTNFDDLFERARRKTPSIVLTSDTAPKLSVPKPNAWTSLVYLHGRIDLAADPDGRQLILTSADFGKAYLTEGWAGRFMLELFRHFSVLFVGYSINDPVMRYLLDALAVDRRLEAGPKNAYALVALPAGQKDEARVKWETRGVVPIFYSEKDGHAALHSTLSIWAERKRGGLTGRANLTKSLAVQDPGKLEPSDRRQLLWAISESSGYCAGIFSTLDPLPQITWLALLDEQKFCLSAKSGALRAYGSLVSRNPSDFAPDLARVALRLAHWMARHLSERELLRWVLQAGGLLHPIFREIIRRALPGAKTSLPPGLVRVWEMLSSDPPVLGRPFDTAYYGDIAANGLHP